MNFYTLEKSLTGRAKRIFLSIKAELEAHFYDLHQARASVSDEVEEKYVIKVTGHTPCWLKKKHCRLIVDHGHVQAMVEKSPKYRRATEKILAFHDEIESTFREINLQDAIGNKVMIEKKVHDLLRRLRKKNTNGR